MATTSRPRRRTRCSRSTPRSRPTGAAVVSAWRVDDPRGRDPRDPRADRRRDRRAHDARRRPRPRLRHPRISPDGRTVAVAPLPAHRPDRPPQPPPRSSMPRRRAAPIDGRRAGLGPLAGRHALDARRRGADRRGRRGRPLAAVPRRRRRTASSSGSPATTAPTRDPCVSPDGAHVYALRNAIDAPAGAGAARRRDAPTSSRRSCRRPRPRRDAARHAHRGRPRRPRTARRCAPGSCCPRAPDAEPAPLLLWIHGGPLHSWNGWTWRWNPWLMAARGYAVLLPDPALSTGYGRAFIDRGWARGAARRTPT